jgi:hypothetical protein
MNSSQEQPQIPQVGGAGSDPAFQPVTIPYFLYEAMARAYYSHPQNVDLPQPEPVKPSNTLNFSGVEFNSFDIPPHWKPGGVAAKDPRNVVPPVQTSEEEG